MGDFPKGSTKLHPLRRNVIASTKVPDEAGAGFAFPQPAYGAERSRDFLRWRYESHPAFTYEFIFSTDYRSVLVFHEERETENGILVLRVVDALCRPEHQSALLSAVVLAGKERGAAIVDFFCSLDCLRRRWVPRGFSTKPSMPTVISRHCSSPWIFARRQSACSPLVPVGARVA